MKVTSYAVGRPAYYDRQSSSTVILYSGTLAPHSLTTRVTSTIPAAQKYMVEFANGYTGRVTAFTVTGNSGVLVYVTGVSLINIYGTLATTTASTVAQQAVNMVVVGGEVIYGATQDSSIGGTVFYDLNIKSTAFTA